MISQEELVPQYEEACLGPNCSGDYLYATFF